MNDSHDQRLRETGWRRPLTEAEQADLRAWLATHPEARSDYEGETRLNQALQKLPDVPVSSNFTARVLQAIEREVAREDHPRARFWRSLDWRGWLPRTAVATFAVAVVLVALQLHHASSRVKMGESLVAVSVVAPVLPPEAAADFDSIRRLSPSTGADTELLALLQ